MKLIDKSALVAEIKRRIDEINQLGKKSSYEVGLVDAYKIILSFIDSMQEEPEITHEIIGKVIKAEREAVWDDARLLAPRLTTEEALIIEIFKLINNE